MSVQPFLSALKSAATSPYAFVAYLAVLAAWTYLAAANSRLRRITSVLAQVPEGQRADLLAREYSTFPRSALSAEQWLRSRRLTLAFLAFLALLVAATVVTVIALVGTQNGATEPETSLSPEAENRRASAVMTGEPVYFEYDRSRVSPLYQEVLRRKALVLQANPALQITLEGNVPSFGTSEYNLAIGNREAEAVRQTLVSMGIAENRISVLSYGEERADRAYDVQPWGHYGWNPNRRVDVRLQSEPGTLVLPAGDAAPVAMEVGPGSVRLAEGEMLGATAIPLLADRVPALRSTVTWSSSDPTVATVERNGVISAVGLGMATITARAGAASGSVNVRVRREQVVYDLTTASTYLDRPHHCAWQRDERLTWYPIGLGDAKGRCRLDLASAGEMDPRLRLEVGYGFSSNSADSDEGMLSFGTAGGSGYVLRLLQTGYSLERHVDGSTHVLIPRSSAPEGDADGVKRVSVEVQGSHITIVMNGSFDRDYEAPEPVRGSIGLEGTSGFGLSYLYAIVISDAPTTP